MLQLQVDPQAVKKICDNLEKQLRFAAALALTNTAKDAQEEVRRQLPQRFTIRTGWVAKGIHVRAADKNTLQTSVRVLDPFMTLQESGGDKISPFGDSLGVPVGARPTPTSVTRPGSFPGALLQKKGFFIAPIAKGSPVKVVWKRTGTGRRQRMTLMYVFARLVHLKPRFGFRDTVRRVAVEGFPRRFAEALRRALASAR
ncbi:MAG: hypothetical protein H7834_10840 [Magnetococcus sp. YQC-9]